MNQQTIKIHLNEKDILKKLYKLEKLESVVNKLETHIKILEEQNEMLRNYFEKQFRLDVEDIIQEYVSDQKIRVH
jgi:hypothetical protein